MIAISSLRSDIVDDQMAQRETDDLFSPGFFTDVIGTFVCFQTNCFFFFFSNCFCSFVEVKNNPKLKDLWLRKEQLFFHSTTSTSTSKLVSHRANLENAFMI